MLAWGLAQGHVVLPKSSDPDRIVGNLRALEVQLSPEELRELDGRMTARAAWDPTHVP
jgi:diketogulonate reductase-like aldo/keto reductase